MVILHTKGDKENADPDAADQPSDGNSSIDSDAAVQKSDDEERSGQDGTAAEVTSEEIKTENHEEETPAEKTAG